MMYVLLAICFVASLFVNSGEVIVNRPQEATETMNQVRNSNLNQSITYDMTFDLSELPSDINPSANSVCKHFDVPLDGTRSLTSINATMMDPNVEQVQVFTCFDNVGLNKPYDCSERKYPVGCDTLFHTLSRDSGGLIMSPPQLGGFIGRGTDSQRYAVKVMYSSALGTSSGSRAGVEMQLEGSLRPVSTASMYIKGRPVSMILTPKVHVATVAQVGVNLEYCYKVLNSEPMNDFTVYAVTFNGYKHAISMKLELYKTDVNGTMSAVPVPVATAAVYQSSSHQTMVLPLPVPILPTDTISVTCVYDTHAIAVQNEAGAVSDPDFTPVKVYEACGAVLHFYPKRLDPASCEVDATLL